MVQMARDVMTELTAFVGSLENWEMDLSFDPDDPASFEAVITAMEEAIDSRAYRFLDLAEQMKEQRPVVGHLSLEVSGRLPASRGTPPRGPHKRLCRW
jgi:hypothetical protein